MLNMNNLYGKFVKLRCGQFAWICRKIFEGQPEDQYPGIILNMHNGKLSICPPESDSQQSDDFYWGSRHHYTQEHIDSANWKFYYYEPLGIGGSCSYPETYIMWSKEGSFIDEDAFLPTGEDRDLDVMEEFIPKPSMLLTIDDLQLDDEEEDDYVADDFFYEVEAGEFEYEGSDWEDSELSFEV